MFSIGHACDRVFVVCLFASRRRCARSEKKAAIVAALQHHREHLYSGLRRFRSHVNDFVGEFTVVVCVGGTFRYQQSQARVGIKGTTPMTTHNRSSNRALRAHVV